MKTLQFECFLIIAAISGDVFSSFGSNEEAYVGEFSSIC